MKTIPLSIKVSLLISAIGLVVFYNLPTDEFGTICGPNSLIPFVIVFIIVLLPFIVTVSIVTVIQRRKKEISNATLVRTFIALIILFLIMSLFFLIFSGCSRCRPFWKRTIVDMKQLSVGQEIFYKKNNRYADTQEELMETLGMSVKFTDSTNKQLADKDGEGIEGGDNNPETWSVTSYISYKEFNDWCKLIDKKYWYICNQDGCYEE